MAGQKMKLDIRVAPLVGYPALPFAGVKVREALNDAVMQAGALLKLDTEICSDVIMTIMDLSVEVEGLGAEILYSGTESPSVTKHPLGEVDDMDGLNWDGWFAESRAGVFVETVKILKQKTSKPICAFIAAPFTMAGLLLGAENMMMEAADENEDLPKLLSKCAAVSNEYVKALEAAGVDGICLLDPTAMMLGPGRYNGYAGKSAGEVISVMNVMSILHICGETSLVLGQMAATGADVLSIDAAVPLDKALGLVSEDTIIMGNLNPSFCSMQSVDAVSEATKEMNASVGGKPNFILSTGCDLPIHTPLENIRAIVDVYRGAAING